MCVHTATTATTLQPLMLTKAPGNGQGIAKAVLGSASGWGRGRRFSQTMFSGVPGTQPHPGHGAALYHIRCTSSSQRTRFLQTWSFGMRNERLPNSL